MRRVDYMKILERMKLRKELKKWRRSRDYAMEKMNEEIDNDDTFLFWASSCTVANIKILEILSKLG